jgi:hypothetical protein
MIDAFQTGGTSPPSRPDLLVRGEGTIYLLFATSPCGEAWIDEHLPEDAIEFIGGIAIEHRFIGDIVRGAIADGLTVR